MYSSKLLSRYLGTRLPMRELVPLAVFLGAAGLGATAPAQVSSSIMAVILAMTLILQFRIWDDIADRDQDRVNHPGRVISIAKNINPVITFSGILFSINGLVLVWLHSSALKPMVYLALCIFILAWYRFRPVRFATSLLNSYLVLLKYPVIVWLIVATTTAPDRILYCLLSVYLIFLIFEVLDDRELQHFPGARLSLISNTLLLVCVWILVAPWNNPGAGGLLTAIWALIIAGTFLLVFSGWSKLGKHTPARNGRALFIVGLLAYIALAMEVSI